MVTNRAEVVKRLREHAEWLHLTYDFGYMDAQTKLCNFAADLLEAKPQWDEARALAQKDAAYTERNKLVCALSKIYPAWLERHPDTDVTWEDDWRWIVFIKIPTRKPIIFGDMRLSLPEKSCFEENSILGREVRQMIAELPLPEVTGSWRLISDGAPKDGTWVLLFSPDSIEPQQFVGQWRDDELDEEYGGAWWADDDGPFCIDADPSHWQPLPAPPVSDTKQEKP